jgi:asparagine synthase (glutamine-hydrolysing)
MPGLNIVVGLGFKIETKQKQLENALKRMDYDPSYSHKALFENQNVGVYFSGYPGYPHYKAELGDKTLIIEGAIYNKSDDAIKTELASILPDVIKGSGNTEALTNFIRETDGEYIAYYIDSALSKVLIFNDAMGRLPAYSYSDKNQFVLGRSMKFMRGCAPEIRFSDWGLIEYFLYSAPLGDRTVFQDVFRLLPYSLFIIDYKNGKHEKRLLYRYNFDDRWEGRPFAEHIKNLHDLFVESVSKRAARFKERKQILSLSGGLDSRANLMGLKKSDVDFSTITFNDYYNQLGRDIPVVETLVETYGLKHKIFRLVAENIPDMEKLIFMKDGSGLMGTMGSAHNSMEITAREFGRDIVYYVGDEGNYTTAPRYGGKRPQSIPELVDTIFAKNSLSTYSIAEVGPIFGKSSKEIYDYLCDYFSGYPEKDNIHKIDRYFVWERSFKFTMENQDRVRLFFWPLAPHYGIKYAPYAFKIKNQDLAGYKVYTEFLRALDKQSVKIKYSNFGIPLESPFLSSYLKLRAIATSSETMRHKLLVVLRLLRNPTKVGLKRQEYGFVDEVREYLKGFPRKPQPNMQTIDYRQLNAVLADEKYLYKMYVAANIVKLFDMVGEGSI